MCKFCKCKDKLSEPLAEEWLFNNIESIGILGELDMGLVIVPKHKEINYNILCGDKEYEKHIPIKYCPMCGREL